MIFTSPYLLLSSIVNFIESRNNIETTNQRGAVWDVAVANVFHPIENMYYVGHSSWE